MNIDVTSISFRLSIGLTIFLILGVRDYLKNREDPKRAKEYLFIAGCSIASIVYAIIHDCITFSISIEYFAIAKDLGEDVKLFPDVVLLATKASYWVGIIVGLVLVVANNPFKNYKQLTYTELAKQIPLPLMAALIFGFLAYFIPDLTEPVFSKGGEEILKDPENFERVAFIHWGTYIGGLLGLVVTALKVLRKRIHY